MHSNESAVMLIAAPDTNTNWAEMSPEVEHGNGSSPSDWVPIRTEPSEILPEHSGLGVELVALEKTSSAA